MSILIKGMNIPSFPAFREKGNKVTFPAAVVLEKGKKPRLLVDYKIGLIDHDLKTYELVEIPTPRGRLIDADELKKKLEKHREMCGDIELAHGIDVAIRILENSPTIIEAENSSAIDDDVKKYCDYLKSETYDFCNRIENGEVSEE